MTRRRANPFYMQFSRLLIFVALLSALAQAQSRFPISDRGKHGFIDSSGKVVIEPKFHAAERFSDGLALVRSGKYYGYIDVNGNWAIQPQFIKAESFDRGFAKVYSEHNYEAVYIGKDGKTLLDLPGAEVFSISGSYVVIRTPSNNCGVYDTKKRRFVVDTVYQGATEIGNNLVTLFERRETPDSLVEQYKIVNLKTGKTIAPFGRYSNVSAFSDGFATATEVKSLTGVVIDWTGRIIFRNNDIRIHNFYFRDGIAAVQNGYIDTNGKYLYQHDNLLYRTNFFKGLAFIHTTERGKSIIDRNFKPVLEDFVGLPQIGNHYIITGLKGDFLVHDLDGKLLSKLAFYDLAELGKELLFYSDDGKSYGICLTNGSIVMEPGLTDIEFQDSPDGIVKVKYGGRDCYLDAEAKVIWLSRDEVTPEQFPSRLGELKLRPVGASAKPKDNSVNSDAVKITQPVSNSVAINLGADPGLFTISINNNTDADAEFTVQDGLLMAMLEANDGKGNWRPITSFRPSGCGNSIGFMTLPARHCWQFPLGQYQGDFETEIRVKLITFNAPYKSETVMLSNAIPAKINPELLYR